MLGNYITNVDQLFLIYRNLAKLVTLNGAELRTTITNVVGAPTADDRDTFEKVAMSGVNALMIDGVTKDSKLIAGVIVEESSFKKQKLRSILRRYLDDTNLARLIIVYYREMNIKTALSLSTADIIRPVSYEIMIFDQSAHQSFVPLEKMSEQEVRKWEREENASRHNLEKIYANDAGAIWNVVNIGDVVICRPPSKLTGRSYQMRIVIPGPK
jgi:hypothetical protein